MKLKDIKSPDLTVVEMQKQHWTKGLPMSLIGCVIYAALRLCGLKPKDYNGICKYFEIGQSWGGFSAGWFFVCGKTVSERCRNHEVGHLVQNAMVGGWSMLWHTVLSIIRYWRFKICKPDERYDDWWFEGDATRLGNEFVKKES